MADGVIIVIDTETGGLDPRLRPLLSACNVIADAELNELDGFELKFIPPEPCHLEVPDPADQFTGTRRPKISHYWDLYCDKITAEKPEEGSIITAVAAELNGFVRPGADDKWDLSSVYDWINQSMTLEEGETTYRRFIRQYFKAKPVAVAHNAPFDSKFLSYHLPEFYEDLHPTWFCTCRAYRKWLKENRGKGSAKLAALATDAGFDQGEHAHEALNDARACLAGLRWLRQQGITID